MLLTIIYQDEYIVAIDKPSGLLVHRSLLDKHETLFALQLLRDQIGQHVFPVHRLDRPTSGVLVFALSAEIAKNLNEQFAAQTIQKNYLAIVRGHSSVSGEIDYGLKEKLDKIADKMANKDKPAQPAITFYKQLAVFDLPYPVSKYPTARFSLLQLTPKTGRKHQLRRHLAHISHPIICDTTHGDGKYNAFVRQQFEFKQLALTCKSMAINHPVTGEGLVLRCVLNNNFKELLEKWHLSPHQLTTINAI